jgi:uncharacterized protein GlcG (DUF336 family)
LEARTNLVPKTLAWTPGAVVWALASVAQAQVPQYGSNVNLEQARKVMAGAMAEARKMGVPMAAAIVGTAGMLVLYERMDNTQTGSVLVSQDKAGSAAMFRRPTKDFQDVLAAGGAVCGGSSGQDGVVAHAGLDTLK